MNMQLVCDSSRYSSLILLTLPIYSPILHWAYLFKLWTYLGSNPQLLACLNFFNRRNHTAGPSKPPNVYFYFLIESLDVQYFIPFQCCNHSVSCNSLPLFPPLFVSPPLSIVLTCNCKHTILHQFGWRDGSMGTSRLLAEHVRWWPRRVGDAPFPRRATL